MSKRAQCQARLALLVITFAALQYTAALGQEPESRRDRPSGATRQPNTFQRQPSQKSSPANDVIGQRGASVNLTDEPKPLIALHVWVLRLADSETQPADELAAKLEEQAANLPYEMGSIRDARAFVERLKAAGLLRQTREFRLTSLDGQSAMLQRGADVPQIIAVQIDALEGRTNSYQMRSVGTLLQTTTRLDSEGRIQIFLQYSSSHIEKTDIPVFERKDIEPVFASAVFVEQFSATTRLKSGTAELISRNSTAGAEQWSGGRTLAIIGAELVSPNEK
jgi:hypothetical protein